MDKFVSRKSKESAKEPEEEIKISVTPAKKPKKTPKKAESTESVPSSGVMAYEDWERQIDSSWKVPLNSFLKSDRLKNIYNWVSKEYNEHTCRPISSTKYYFQTTW